MHDFRPSLIVRGCSLRDAAIELTPLLYSTQQCVVSVWLSTFNNSFVFVVGLAIGNGVYFASSASYSISGYSTPDASGQKYIYLARVLTGKSAPGKSGLKEPPVGFDSVTSGGTFVVFYDAQTYPEYLITFKWQQGRLCVTVLLCYHLVKKRILSRIIIRVTVKCLLAFTSYLEIVKLCTLMLCLLTATQWLLCFLWLLYLV